MEKSDAAVLLGVPESEIAEVLDGPAGDLITTIDGQAYVNLPDGAPDASGRTGLMFLQPPHEHYAGAFPVYDGTVVTSDPAEQPAPKRRRRNTGQAEPVTDPGVERDTGNDPNGAGDGDDDGDGVDPTAELRAELGGLDRDELLAVARDRGVDVQAAWAAERIIEAILDTVEATPAGGDA